MIERLKRGILGWDLSNINPDKSKYFKRFSTEERTHIKHILQMNTEHVLYIMDSEEKIFQSAQMLNSHPSKGVFTLVEGQKFLHWRLRNPSIMGKDFRRLYFGIQSSTSR